MVFANYFSIIFLLNLSMRDFLHFVKNFFLFIRYYDGNQHIGDLHFCLCKRLIHYNRKCHLTLFIVLKAEGAAVKTDDLARDSQSYA